MTVIPLSGIRMVMSEQTSCPMSAAVRSAYTKGEEDETLGPLVLTDSGAKPLGRIQKGDSVIFYNIRGEREIELTESLTKKGFKAFAVRRGAGSGFYNHDPIPPGVGRERGLCAGGNRN